MAGKGSVFTDLTTLTMNGNDIKAEINRVEIRRTRGVVKWACFGDTAYSQDVDMSDESVHFVGVYTSTANEAFDVLSDCYEASSGGTSGTLSFKPSSSGYTFGAVGKFTDAPITFGRGEVATIEFTMAVAGTISRTG